MADSSSCLRLLFYVSTLTFFMGVNLVSTLKCLKKTWYWTSLILQTFFFSASIYFSLWITAVRWTLHFQEGGRMSGQFTLHLIADILFSVGYHLTQLTILFRRNQIVTLTKNVFDRLTLTDKKRLLALSRCLCLVSLGYCMLIGLLMIPWRLYSVSIQYLRANYFLYPHPGAIAFETIIENLNQSFVTTSLAVYLVFFNVVHLFVCRQLFNIETYLKKSLIADLTQVCDSLCSTITVMNEFENTFSVLPFFWFTYLFAYASDQVLYIRNIRSPKVLVFTLAFVIEFVCVIVAVVFMSSQSNSLHQETKKIERQLLNVKGNSFIKSRAVAHLESISSFKVTAWKMFYLEKPFLMSFIGTVLTFSVLFIDKATRSDGLLATGTEGCHIH